MSSDYKDLSRKHQVEFTATPFKTDVRFTVWFQRQREIREHQSLRQTGQEIGVHESAVQVWVTRKTPPRVHKMIILISEWSGEPIRLIRGMIEYEAKVADQQQIEIRDENYVPPWRTTPEGRQAQVAQFMESQISFYDKQSSSSMKEFANSLRAALNHLRDSAKASRDSKKEVEMVRPKQRGAQAAES